MATPPGGITVPLKTSYAYCEYLGKDPVALATQYFQAWAAKVPAGTETIFSKIKCELADGPCGCAEDSTNAKCTGPYAPVPLEILLDILEKGVEGVGMLWYPAPQCIVVDGHVHQVEKIGPHSMQTNTTAKAVYVKKL